MTLSDDDRKIIKLLLRDESLTQSSIAAKIGSPLEAVYRSVRKLVFGGIAELSADSADARKRTPRLRIFPAFEALESTVSTLVGATV